MSQLEGELVIPDQFPFPYEKPYDIQVNFMKALYKTLELKKVGIFESPTGTGKSLSLICGSMKWLRDFKERQKNELDNIIANEKKKNEESNLTGFDWLTDYQQNFDSNQKNLEKKEYLSKQTKQEAVYQEMKNKAKAQYNNKQQKLKEQIESKKLLQSKLTNLSIGTDQDKDDIFKDELDVILDDYKSDNEDGEPFEEDENKEEPVTKIFFCSRTHSQISQFIGELQKTVYAEHTRVVTLGSRMNLCINDTVLKLGSFQAVNDRCLELQKNKKSSNNKEGTKKTKLDSNTSCAYHKSSEYSDFNVKMLEETIDIEDLAKLGRSEKICPYYGARHSINTAEIVALPYNLLFQKETRESFNINLKNQVVIIDEAHNLIDTIASIHSVEISDQHVSQALAQLNNYMTRYRSRFAAKNMLYLKHLLNILNTLNKFFTAKPDDVKFEAQDGKLSLKSSKMWTINEFLVATKFFNLNFVKILRFCEETQLEKKVSFFGAAQIQTQHPLFLDLTSAFHFLKLIGFTEKFYNKESDKKTEDSENHDPKIVADAKKQPEFTIKSPIMQIKQLLKALSCPFYDGRILLTIDSPRSTLKFILLNPSICFEDIISNARAVILAGGTMKPIADFEHLIGGRKEIEHFSCGHVIPKGNLIAVSMGTGPTGGKLEFSFNFRDNPKILDELGRQLLKLADIVPSGMVVFFVSYDYMDKVVNHFKKSNVMNQLNERKQVYYEPRLSSDCDRVFNEYIKNIRKPKPGSKQTGSILFSVVGGKMSEGINFSDDLGRCVVVVGLPYANIKSLELQEKMAYLNKQKSVDGKGLGQHYYENICWKAINQSIGRAIRHQNDYSTIILLDNRYCTATMSSMMEKLPQWIGDNFRQEDKESFDYKKIMDTLTKFYANKAAKEQQI